MTDCVEQLQALLHLGVVKLQVRSQRPSPGREGESESFPSIACNTVNTKISLWIVPVFYSTTKDTFVSDRRQFRPLLEALPTLSLPLQSLALHRDSHATRV